MRIFQLIIIWVASFCSSALAADDFLTWEKLPDLPPMNGQEKNPGVAGPFVGIHNNALIVAGGANFPGKPLWETDKVWHDDIYVLVRGESSYDWKGSGKLNRPLAYGASVSTDAGVVCIGGDDATEVYKEVFLLSWDNDKNQLNRTELPSLPEPVAYGAATFVNGTVYLVGGQTGKSLKSATNKVYYFNLERFNKDVPTEWNELPEIPWSSRAFVQVASQHNGYDDCVYVIGGRREDCLLYTSPSPRD